MAGGREGVAQSQLDAVVPRYAELLELQLEEGKRGRPGFHVVERGFRNSRPGNDRSERQLFFRADTADDRRQARADAEPGQFHGEWLRIFLVAYCLEDHGARIAC